MTTNLCPLCDGERLIRFLHRPQVPVHQNLLLSSLEAARSLARGELDMVICADCGFVFNRAFDPALLSYGEQYDNTQACSPCFDAYLDGLVADLVEHHGVRHSTIVEVGCGKGHFLQKLVAYPASHNRGIGFDPSYVGPDTVLEGLVRFQRRFYDESCADVKADVVVCRHVIEHIPQPLVLLRAVRAALNHAPDARVFFETPCVEWILRHQVIWDFFYEHCSLFCAASLRHAFERSGFTVLGVTPRFGEQYLWLEAKPASALSALPREDASALVALAQDYGKNEAALRQTWFDRLQRLRRSGKIAIWGAGAKGVTFANLIDPECALIECVVDLNPAKQGRYLPGTGHPIVSPSELPSRHVAHAILMNPNYREENLCLLTSAGITLDLIDWGHTSPSTS